MARKIKNKGRHARRKGHQFERDIAIELKGIYPDVRRHLEYQDAEANGVDLVNTGRYRIQCKKLKAYASINTIKEIQCDEMLGGEVPILVTAGDNMRAMVVMPFDEFKRLLEAVSK